MVWLLIVEGGSVLQKRVLFWVLFTWVYCLTMTMSQLYSGLYRLEEMSWMFLGNAILVGKGRRADGKRWITGI